MQGMPCIVVDGYNKINWNVYFCVALVRRSFHPSSLLGKFIERGRRYRAIGDGRRLLFNGATTCRRIKIKKLEGGGDMKNGKNTFLSCNVNTEIAFLLSSLFFSLIETY